MIVFSRIKTLIRYNPIINISLRNYSLVTKSFIKNIPTTYPQIYIEDLSNKLDNNIPLNYQIDIVDNNIPLNYQIDIVDNTKCYDLIDAISELEWV